MDVDGEREPRPRRRPDLLLRPVVRRHLRDEVPRRRAERRAGVPNVPGGSIIEIARLEPGFRPLVWLSLVGRTPPLANLPGLFQFNENIPLRNLPPLVDTVPGRRGDPAADRVDGVGDPVRQPVAYAPHLRAEPLAGVPAKSIILQFARGDKTVPNPTTSGDHPGRRPREPDDALPERPRRSAHSGSAVEPAHVPDGDRRRTARRSRSQGAGADRDFFAYGRRRHDRPGRRRRRSSRRRWSGRRRRIWPTSRSAPREPVSDDAGSLASHRLAPCERR